MVTGTQGPLEREGQLRAGDRTLTSQHADHAPRTVGRRAVAGEAFAQGGRGAVVQLVAARTLQETSADVSALIHSR